MIGAVIGDVVGSRFEQSNRKSKSFDFFDDNCRPTDDTIMSLAVQDAIRSIKSFQLTDNEAKEFVIAIMQSYGKNYPGAGYGSEFYKWLQSDHPAPYNSYGNGAIMRISSLGFELDNLNDIEHYAELITAVSHNHPEAIKAAKAFAGAIYIARTTKDKNKVAEHIKKFGYTIPDLNIIRPTYKFDASCQGTLPEAVAAFIESTDFEDAIRNAISIGGDSDTIACCTGALAEAYYGVPEEMVEELRHYMGSNLYKLLM